MTDDERGDYEDTITRLTAELAEARKDSARLDWLESLEVIEGGYLILDGAVCSGSPFEWLSENGRPLRAAIDAAKEE